MLFQEGEVTKSLSRNLFKQHSVSVDFEKTRVIDTNELAQKKIEELNRKMRESVRDRGLDEFEAEFTEGIEAFKVAQLLGDEVEEDFNEGGVFKAAPPVYEGPSEEEIQQMIEERLAEADRQAEEIISRAQNEAVNIRNQAHSDGMRQGYDEGILKAQAEFQAMEMELQQKAELLERDYDMKIAQLEPMCCRRREALVVITQVEVDNITLRHRKCRVEQIIVELRSILTTQCYASILEVQTTRNHIQLSLALENICDLASRPILNVEQRDIAICATYVATLDADDTIVPANHIRD